MKFGRRENLFASPPDGAAAPSNGSDGGNGVPQLPPPQAAPPKRRSESRELNAFLGRGCIYEGKLTFEGRVRIDGQFTGEIFTNDTLEIGPDAEIEAEIDVSTVIIAGHVTGNILARSRCDLRAPAQVVGNIVAPVITMEEGVRFDGEMKMSDVLDEVVRAPTRRAPSPADATVSTVKPGSPMATATGRRAAPPSRDPSELLKPVP